MNAREFFDQLPRRGPDATEWGALYRFDVGPVDDKTSWYVELTDDNQLVRCAPQDKVDCSVQCSEEDFIGMMTHRVNPLTAYMQGRLVINGDPMIAQRFHSFIRSHEPVPGAVA